MHQSLRANGWPYIDPEVMNVTDLSFSIPHWPMSQHAHHPYFVQLAAVQYYYGIAAANARQFLLGASITPFHRPALFKGCLNSV